MSTLLTPLRASSPLETLKSLSPLQADVIKTIALLAMLADHVNSILLNGRSSLLYSFGHAAFPLFTILWAINLPLDKKRLKQRARRLWMWAVITQPLFWLAFMMSGQSWLALNILFAYAGCTQLLSWERRWGVNGCMAGTALLLIMVWPLTPASYGVNGILFCLLCMLIRSAPSIALNRLIFAVALAVMAWLNMPPVINGWWVDAIVYDLLPTLILPLLIIGAVSAIPQVSEARLWPRRFFYHAYAAHLILLGVIAALPVRN